MYHPLIKKNTSFKGQGQSGNKAQKPASDDGGSSTKQNTKRVTFN